MKRRYQILLALAVILLAGAGLFFFMPATLAPVRASERQPTGEALIERGRYLATAADCVACHTRPGGSSFAGGLAFVLPFGTIYSSNITSDRETGIGRYSDAEFVRAMRHGVRRDGQELYPAFPYTSYTGMSTDDVLAIRAWLHTLPPVRARVQANSLVFPFNQRWLMRGWKLLFHRDQRFEPASGQTAQWNRGAYLVDVVGHCGECHTPRNILFALRPGQKLAGEVSQGWNAYNITSDPDYGIGDWSAGEIAAYLKQGHAAGRGVASGKMAEAVEMSLSHLTMSDIMAMAVYMKSVPPRRGSGTAIDRNPRALATSTAFSPPASRSTNELGSRIFAGACASCHGWDGSGLQTPYAGLRGLHGVNDPTGSNIIRVILHGNRFRTASGTVEMPAYGHAYSDAEVAAVTNYVIAHFGGKAGSVTPADVSEARLQKE